MVHRPTSAVVTAVGATAATAALDWALVSLISNDQCGTSGLPLRLTPISNPAASVPSWVAKVMSAVGSVPRRTRAETLNEPVVSSTAALVTAADELPLKVAV